MLTGGRPIDRPGNFYPPTVLTNITKESPTYREELFGPVACVYRVKNIDAAIALANDSSLGLGASAWTNDATERDRFVNEIEAGMVFINKMVASDPRPFGGVEAVGAWARAGRAGHSRAHQYQIRLDRGLMAGSSQTKLGFVAGREGGNMVARLLEKGHAVTG